MVHVLLKIHTIYYVVKITPSRSHVFEFFIMDSIGNYIIFYSEGGRRKIVGREIIVGY